MAAALTATAGDANETAFRSSFANYQHYPHNVLDRQDRLRLIDAYLSHHKKTRGKILLSGRRTVRTSVPIHDIEPHREFRIQTPEALRTVLSWPVTAPPVPQPQAQRARGPHPHGPHRIPLIDSVSASPPITARQQPPAPNPTLERLVRDPLCRFILFEMDTSKNHLLNLSEEVLLLILTYHQVSPCYLNFITCFSSQTGSSDLRFGGFRCQKSFSLDRNRSISALGRSGLQYQLCFKLKTVLHKEPSPTDGLGRTSGWSQPQAAVYHSFDILEGRAVWIITSPKKSFPGNAPRNHLWEQIIETESFAGVASQLPQERFRASLDVMITLGEWSLSDSGFYIQDIEEKLDELTDEYLDDPQTPVIDERKLQEINNWMQELNHCILRLEGNLRVLQSILAFYHKQLLKDTANLRRSQQPGPGNPPRSKPKARSRSSKQRGGAPNPGLSSLPEEGSGQSENQRETTDEETEESDNETPRPSPGVRQPPLPPPTRPSVLNSVPNPNWLGSCHEHISFFGRQMKSLIEETREILERAKVLRTLATNRENFIQKILQNRTTKRLSQLSWMSQNEATVMRVFQTITLVLLPMTVVSTILSTDIVKFQNIGGGSNGPDNSNQPTPAYTFSLPAFIVFLVLAFISTLFTWIWSKVGERVAKKRLMDALAKSMAEKGISGEDNLDPAAMGEDESKPWNLPIPGMRRRDRNLEAEDGGRDDQRLNRLTSGGRRLSRM